ncbi:MAG TPA: chemotaxis protein CheB [Gammaproteobacteria bacterium]|nr:chemotaxis protein CheB [Gammaproteobacteria bacterium]
MAEAAIPPLRVVVIAQSTAQRTQLKSLLEDHGAEVVECRELADYPPEGIDRVGADVLLVNLDRSMETQLERLEMLIEEAALPILFNEDGVLGTASRARTLFTKLNALAGTGAPTARPASPCGDSADRGAVVRPVLRVVSNSPGPDPQPARRVWVLGASLGGPPALRQFFSVLPPDLPLAFVVAQHIGGAFVSLLSEQLNRLTAFEVAPAADDQRLCHGQVAVAPVDRRFTIDEEGRIELSVEHRHRTYNPSIDDALHEVSRRYGEEAGAIIFSGMGTDGARGCTDVAEQGGTVWVQEPESCIISSMPDAARATGTVSFTGTPDELARRLTDFVRERARAS